MRATSFGTALLLLLTGAPSAQAKEPAKPAIVFLDVEAAATAIADESLEPYFALLQTAEMEAKTGGDPFSSTDLAAQRAKCKERYRKGVRAFADDEQRALTTLAERLHGAWASRYPRIADLAWSFLGTEDVIEGGLPHTRGRSIVIPHSVGKTIVEAVRRGGSALHEHLNLLAHEQSHVLQRLEPKLFDPLYATWGFLKVEGLAPAPDVLARHVVNPDGVRTEWVFPLKEGGSASYLHPLVAFRDLTPPHRMPHEFELIAVELVKEGGGFRPKKDPKRGELAIRSLESVTAYGAHFGGIFENFHPNEIFAVLFATMLVKDHFDGEGLPQPSDAVGKDFAKLRSWCAKNLGSKAAVPAR